MLIPSKTQPLFELKDPGTSSEVFHFSYITSPNDLSFYENFPPLKHPTNP